MPLNQTKPKVLDRGTKVREFEFLSKLLRSNIIRKGKNP